MKSVIGKRCSGSGTPSSLSAVMIVGLSGATIFPETALFARRAMIARSESNGWRLDQHQHVATIATRFAPIVYYAPTHPRRVLVLAFGYPWDEASDARILSYAQANVSDWAAFADRNQVLIVAPALGGSNFVDYRELSGRLTGPDIFVDTILEGPVRELIPGWNGKFCLHGHSAGAQFAARYVIAHPDRLECAILSAPSTYAMPTRAVAWPFGMGAPQGHGQRQAPVMASWIAAATSTPVRVIVGSLDTETRPSAPGQSGVSRLARAQAWVAGMRALVAHQGRRSQVTFAAVPGSAHEEHRMAVAAMGMLERFYHGPSGT